MHSTNLHQRMDVMESSADVYLAALLEEIPSLVEEANHSEILGVDLLKGNPAHVKAILNNVSNQRLYTQTCPYISSSILEKSLSWTILSLKGQDGLSFRY